MSCPHREPCEQCRAMERSSKRQFAVIAAVLAAIVALWAVVCACELDPRASGFVGMAIGCVLMYFYNTAELRRLKGEQ